MSTEPPQKRLKNGITDENFASFLCDLTNGKVLRERKNAVFNGSILLGFCERVRNNVPEQLARIDHLVKRVPVAADLDKQRAR